jgi:RsiW-degrading membrane proteinase PrsW (M82 family)
MLIFFIIVALFVAWIWVDYFRLIDIFDKNGLGYVALVFFLGCASTLLVFPANDLFVTPFDWGLNGEFFNDLLYTTFGIGMIEEVAKIIPFLLFHRFFKSHLREPIDYIAFVAISALGFSAAENVLYFYRYGSGLIDTRSILCSVGHMFFTCIFAYGFVLLRFNPKYKNPFLLLGTLLLASFAHGLYDFFLMFKGMKFGYLVTILYFFFTISIFATILNNALNNSSYFTYKKSIDIDLITKRMLMYYGVVFAAQFALVTYEFSFGQAMMNLLRSLFMPGIIITVCVARLSRFRLIEGRWNPIKVELPFHIFGRSESLYEGFRPFSLRVRGTSFNEVYLSKFYQEYVNLIPISMRNTMLQAPKLAYLEKKVFLKNDEPYYITRLYHTTKEGSYDVVLLKPKTNGITRTKKDQPLVGLMEVREVPANKAGTEFKKKYKFREWVYLRAVG